MLAVETPQPLSRKKSLFRRFSKREPRERNAPSLPSPTMIEPPRLYSKPQREAIIAQRGLPTPPDSPTSIKITNLEPVKPAKPHQPQFITSIQRIDIPQKPQKPVHQSHSYTSPNKSLRVLPNALPTTPFPGTPQIRPWNVFLLPSQVFSLYLGHLPRDFSDKWYIYSEGPDQTGKLKVHFHRSWTGMKIAELFVVMDVKGEGAGKLVGIKWNDSDETNRMTEEEAKYWMRLTCRKTMGLELEDGSD